MSANPQAGDEPVDEARQLYRFDAVLDEDGELVWDLVPFRPRPLPADLEIAQARAAAAEDLDR